MTEEEASRRDAIIQAALHVFARNGFHKASIKQIATEAGLKSPSLIYWYFKDKTELLQAVMGHLMPLVNQVASPDAMMDLPPEQLLKMVAAGYFGVFGNPDAVRLMRLFLSEALHSAESIAPFADRIMKTILNFMVTYLQHQIDTGRLRQHDPQVSARAFMGMLLTYVLMREIIPSVPGLPDAAHYQEEIIRIFLDGLRE